MIHDLPQLRTKVMKQVSVWKLAQDNEAYGKKAGWYILVSPNGEEEVAPGKAWSTREDAEAYATDAQGWEVVPLQIECTDENQDLTHYEFVRQHERLHRLYGRGGVVQRPLHPMTGPEADARATADPKAYGLKEEEYMKTSDAQKVMLAIGELLVLKDREAMHTFSDAMDNVRDVRGIISTQLVAIGYILGQMQNKVDELEKLVSADTKRNPEA
jgi:hypothetical protein